MNVLGFLGGTLKLKAFLDGSGCLLSKLKPKLPTALKASCLLNLVAGTTGGWKSVGNETKFCSRC